MSKLKRKVKKKNLIPDLVEPLRGVFICESDDKLFTYYKT